MWRWRFQISVRGQTHLLPESSEGTVHLRDRIERELAERLILDQVGKITQQTREWLDELKAALTRASVALQEHAPTETR